MEWTFGHFAWIFGLLTLRITTHGTYLGKDIYYECFGCDLENDCQIFTKILFAKDFSGVATGRLLYFKSFVELQWLKSSFNGKILLLIVLYLSRSVIQLILDVAWLWFQWICLET